MIRHLHNRRAYLTLVLQAARSRGPSHHSTVLAELQEATHLATRIHHQQTPTIIAHTMVKTRSSAASNGSPDGNVVVPQPEKADEVKENIFIFIPNLIGMPCLPSPAYPADQL